MKMRCCKSCGILLVSVAMYLFCFLQAYSKEPDGGRTIQSAFNPKAHDWEIAWPGRVSQYDVVYLSPPVHAMQGIPLGNGDVGVLIWMEDSKIMAVVNKSDLWDDAASGPFRNWSAKEEDYSTTLRHACRVIIDFKYPVFSSLYLSEFKAKLNLADASLSLESTSAFGKVSLKAFVDHESGTLFCDFSSDLNEDVPLDAAVERFGSRTFSHWYSQVNRDATIGLAGTEAIAGDKSVCISQKLTGGTFAVGGSVMNSNGLRVAYSREHSRRAVIHFSGSRQKSAQIAVCVTSPVAGDPVPEVRKSLAYATDRGIGQFRESQAEAWKSIWNRSFMDYGDDYLNNLWHLTLYYANTSQGGKYPGRFNNGMWSWNRDIQQWNFYFHWNQQQLYWPLNAAGYHELVDPYLEYRFKSLPHAKKDAKETFNANGAFISDVAERRGYNSSGEHGNHTPVAEIALDFWRQYRYTCDEKFLKEKALPFIIEAARFFEHLLVREADGLYHAREGTGYEGWIKLKDGLTEIAYGRALFATALQALREADTEIPEAKKWTEILENLAPVPLIEAEEAMIGAEDGVFKIKSGFFKGKTVSTNKITPGGWGITEGKWLPVWGPPDSGNSGLKCYDGIFPSVPSSTVFPSNLTGLGQKDQNSGLFHAVQATTILYANGPGWDPGPIVLARLGLADELAEVLSIFPERFQPFYNGWGQWGMEGEVRDPEYLIYRTAMVRDAASPRGEKFPLSMQPFRHMSMESMSVLAAAMNESMFQSYDGILRIAPAFPESDTGRFTLHAVGGFIVSSEIRSGEVEWVSIKSLTGKTCKLAMPWNTAKVQSSLKKNSFMISGEVVEIKTKPNEVIMIYPEGKDLTKWSVINEIPVINEKVRYHSSGKIHLGIPRMF